MGIELEADERWSFLEDHATMSIATVDPNGYPHVAPVWYLSRPDDDCVYFNTPENSRKARDLDAMPKASATVEAGRAYLELRAVVFEGDVSVVDEADREAIKAEWCQKYFEQSTLPDYMQAIRHGRNFQWYRLKPTRWISWDNAKIDVDKLT